MNLARNVTRLLPAVLAMAMLLWAMPAAAEEIPETTFQAAPESDSELNYLNDGWAVLSAAAQEEPPDSFDLRQNGWVSAVRDQNPFGTCWTFAVMGAMESNLRTQGITGVDLSEAQLAFSCGASLYRLESLETYLEDDKGTDAFTLYSNAAERLTFGFTEGGNDDIAVGALASWVGPISEEKMPYSEVGETCGEEVGSDAFREGAETLVNKWEKDPTLEFGAEYHLQNALYFGKGMLTGNDAAALGRRNTVKKLLQQYGAVSIGYNSYGNDLCVNNQSVTTQNHAVLLVGWDNEFPRENFPEYCRPDGDGAWLVRNNYGTDWGDAGHFWISYEDTSLSMEPVYLMENSDNYDHIYQHDRLGWKSSISAELNDEAVSGEAYMASIFEAEGDGVAELLEAVSFYTTDANVDYTITIYTDVEAGRPASGVQVTESQTGTQEYPGYHTVRLEEPVELTPGEQFSVVIHLRNQPDGYAFPIAVESAISEEQPYLLGIERSTGFVSAVRRDEQGNCTPAEWHDVTEVQNEQGRWPTAVCIKAFTTDWHRPVHLSSLSNTVADGTEVTLRATGAQSIQYTINGGEPRSLPGSSGNVTLAFGDADTLTLRAWAEYEDGSVNEDVFQVYQKAAVDVVDVYGAAAGAGGVSRRYAAEKKVGEDGQVSYTVTLPAGLDEARFQVCGGDSVWYGEELTFVDAGTWSEKIDLGQEGSDGSHSRLLTVEVSKDGYTDTRFDVFFYSPAPEEYAVFDCEQETMTVKGGYMLIYEEEEVETYFASDAISQEDGTTLFRDVTFTSPDFEALDLAGETLTVYHYVSTKNNKDTWETVKDSDGEAVTVQVPERRSLPVLDLDYAAWDGSNAVPLTAKLAGDEYDLQWAWPAEDGASAGDFQYFVRQRPAVGPGDVIYLSLPANQEGFASPVTRVQIPAAPGAVTGLREKAAAGDSVEIYLELPDGPGSEEWPWPSQDGPMPDYQVEYTIDDGETWYGASLYPDETTDETYFMVTGLDPAQEYPVRVRMAAFQSSQDPSTPLRAGRWPGEADEIWVSTGAGYRLPYYLTYNGFQVEELTQYFLLTEEEPVTAVLNWEEMADEYFVAPAGEFPEPVEVTWQEDGPSVASLSCEITYLTARMPEEMTYRVSYYDETGNWLEDMRFTFLTSGAVTYGTLPTPEGTVLDESQHSPSQVATRLVIDEKGRMYADTPWVKCRVVEGGRQETYQEVKLQGRAEKLYNSDLTDALRREEYASAADVTKALREALKARLGDAFREEDLRVYEGITQCVLDGKVCVDADLTAEEMERVMARNPELYGPDGFTVTLRLKDEKGKPLTKNWEEYTPVVVHMYAKDENGHTAGEVEFLTPQDVPGESDVVQVRTKSLSPLAVTWVPKSVLPAVPTATPQPQPQTQPQSQPQTGAAAPAAEHSIPSTGDVQAPVLWICLLGISAAGFAALRRKTH